MEYLGLLLEILFFGFGLYLYLLAIGRISTKDPGAAERLETFRKRNAWWMRIGGLAIMALMLVNIYLHIVQLWNG